MTAGEQPCVRSEPIEQRERLVDGRGSFVLEWGWNLQVSPPALILSVRGASGVMVASSTLT